MEIGEKGSEITNTASRKETLFVAIITIALAVILLTAILLLKAELTTTSARDLFVIYTGACGLLLVVIGKITNKKQGIKSEKFGRLRWILMSVSVGLALLSYYLLFEELKLFEGIMTIVFAYEAMALAVICAHYEATFQN